MLANATNPPPLHRWTNEEEAFKRKNQLTNLTVPLAVSWRYRLGKSLFGGFLEEFNPTQHQDSFTNRNKLEIVRYSLRRYTKHDLEVIQSRNRFLGEYFKLLEEAVSSEEVIQVNYLKTTLVTLFLDCSFVTEMDCTLLHFSNLLVMTLCGNYLPGVQGRWLPRRLEVLDLYDNLITDLGDLITHAPKSLKVLGLGRNLLHDSSSLHLLACCPNLLSVDLSENNINFIETIKLHQGVRSLALLGNPGAFQPTYLNTIMTFWPSLAYLDYTEVLEGDREVLEVNNKTPQIIFQCYRVLGLPQPPKDRKNLQTFHVEVLFPLGESVEELPQVAKPKKGGYYSGANEYNKKSEEENVWWKTSPVVWSKVMEFQPIQVNPQNNLTHLRDTFRSVIPVRLVYLKIEPKKKEILKKLTIASFHCPLSSPNWSEKFQDFYWADHPDVGVTAQRVDGSLQAVQYDLDANKKKSTKDVEEVAKEALPRILTCQVGFGIQ